VVSGGTRFLSPGPVEKTICWVYAQLAHQCRLFLRAGMRGDPDLPVPLQLTQGLANGRSANPELDGEVSILKKDSRLEAFPWYRVSEMPVDVTRLHGA